MAPSNTSAAKKAPSLKQLTTRLKEIQATFNNIWVFVETFREETSVSQVNVRLEKLDDLWERFGDTLVDIKSHDDFVEEEDSYQKERQEFSARYYNAKSFLMDKVRERQEPGILDQSIRGHDASMLGTLDHVRLPQIKLQSFNGNIDEWLSFRDLFSSLIHFKTDLSEVEKFHYLKGCLQGEPKALIDSLPITKANYQIAWEMLLKRYNNSKQLKKRQIQSLFKLATLSKESISDLQGLLEGFQKIVQTLDQIVQPNDYKDLLLVNILTSRLDSTTRRSWEEFSSTKEQDTLQDLTDFLQRRIRILESIPSRPAFVQQVPFAAKPRSSMIRTTYNAAQTFTGCVACPDHHPLYQCNVFQRMAVSERDSLLRKRGLCRNCFRQGHQAKECQSKYSCRHCKGRHHSLVCFKTEKGENLKAAATTSARTSASASGSNETTIAQVANEVATESSVSNAAQRSSSQVLLATAIVIVEDEEQVRFPVRALLDSGSESNFITERLSQRLKVTRNHVDISVLGIGSTMSKVRQRVRAKIRSRVSDFSRGMSFLVLPKVTVNLPTANVDATGWKIPPGIELADPSFFVSEPVDVVLGIEFFFDFFESGRRISLGDNLPALNDSVFGWVVCGGSTGTSQPLHVNCNAATSENLELLMTRFWSCEDIGSTTNYSLEEAKCEEFFVKTVQREPDGRYTVRLPKNEGISEQLGSSKDIAYRRLLATERRLARDVELKNQYDSFLNEYWSLGHMQKVVDNTEVNRCYLPHHPVVKEASTTTKVRVVFDASCKTSTNVSLNDVLLAGPTIQQDLRSIILRCRTKQIMIVADVEKMFRQINMHPQDRPLQSILWRPSLTEEPATYELNTVTYGTKPAPFLATRTLKQLALDEQERFPEAAMVVNEDAYMDDIITGGNDPNEVLNLRIQLEGLLISGGFRLRKWASNCARVLEGIEEENLAIQNFVNLDSNQTVKALGLTWLPAEDVLRFDFKFSNTDYDVILTKRRILSIIATLFDPLGIIGATITTAKILMQSLWIWRDENERLLEWDQPVPQTVGETWRNFHEQLPLLNEIRINRCVIIPRAVMVEIHCFSDASEKAYGGCIYLKSQNLDGVTRVHLLTSKSKVAPLKTQTIPRLELCGALLVAQLYERVQQAIKTTARSIFWTDSTCTLNWIQSAPNNWTSFVANRVAKIQTITEGCEWRHVPGTHNPADLISRGISPHNIVSNTFWWHGPSWLSECPENWPQSIANTGGREYTKEQRRTTVIATTATEEQFISWYLSKFSSYSSLIRRTAIWRRIIKMLQGSREKKTYKFITTAELQEAEVILIRLVQLDAFADEWKALTNGGTVSSKSPLRWFNPFISQENLLKVGGRLVHSQEAEDTKHPIILPARHRLTRMIMQYYHQKLLHAGPQLMLSTIRLRFWPLGGKSVAKLIVHSCQRCYRMKPSATHQFMGELPAPRVRISRPFSKAGVDYFGPIFIRPGPRRTAVKAYVAIFICLCTKAVHMELVSDLSTERFLQALRRFMARRGKSSDIYSDNGTNLVGARNKLNELLRLLRNAQHHDKVIKMCTEEGINWHFNPPSAPHFGGIWEAAVRSAKHHLMRVVGDTPISHEDMNTLLIQIEGCLNSRPITQLSNDPNDLEPLTPAHFLIGSSLQALPELDVSAVPLNRLNHWQQVQRKLQDFWKRWRREYLSQLQGRTKRWRPPIAIEVGKLVIIQEDNQPPMKWKMGRIEIVHPGKDGIVRVVTLKTATGLLKRPVEKICLLPTIDPNDVE